jgi:polyphosphate glucokinase
VQGFGAISGKGFEFVMTLGTGFGTALFYNGQLLPHMEFAHFPIRKKYTLNQWLGNAELKAVGKKRWNARVAVTIEAFRTLLNFDTLYIGGGNAKKLTIDLPQDVKIIPNEMGLIGGIRLWGNGVKLPETGA